jgi:hypothetical protein
MLSSRRMTTNNDEITEVNLETGLSDEGCTAAVE